MQRYAPVKLATGPWLCLCLCLAACGDDSKPIAEQWPGYTAGASPSGALTSSAGVSSVPDSTPTTSPGATSTSSSSSSSSTTQSTTTSSGGTATVDPTICSTDAYRCVTAVPDQWEGPIARKSMTAQGFVPSCDGEYRFEVNATPYHADPNFSAATCTACSCATPTGGTCSSVSNVEYFKEVGCQSADLLTTVPTVLADGSCSAVPNATGLAKSVKVPGITLDRNTASCKPQGGFASKSGFSWRQQERLCRSRGTEKLKCPNAAELCVPKVPTSFAQGVCIYRDGDHSCPAQGYTNKTLLFQGTQDDRGCTACACGAVTGNLSCTGYLRQFPNNTCTEAKPTVSESLSLQWGQPSTCGDVNSFIQPAGVPQGVSLDIQVSGLAQAQCAASGGAPTGQVQGTNPVTLCCTGS